MALAIMTDSERIHALTQSVIAVLVVIGAGFAIMFRPESVTVAASALTLVIGFYFGQTANKSGANTAITAAQAATAETTAAAGGKSP